MSPLLSWGRKGRFPVFGSFECFLFTFTDPKPTSGFLFICIGDGCTGGDYVLMFLSILFTICCCLCCHKLRGNAEEDRQATDIPLAEVFSPQDQENLRIMKQQMEEVKDHKAANVHLADISKHPSIPLSSSQACWTTFINRFWFLTLFYFFATALYGKDEYPNMRKSPL